MGDQSGTDEIFMAAQEAVGAATGQQQRDSQGRHGLPFHTLCAWHQLTSSYSLISIPRNFVVKLQVYINNRILKFVFAFKFLSEHQWERVKEFELRIVLSSFSFSF